MSLEQRARLLEELPSSFSFEPLEALPPEGDPHPLASASTRFTLDAFFRRTGRKIYISSNLGVFYAGRRLFAADVLAVRDVEPIPRQTWVVDAVK